MAGCGNVCVWQAEGMFVWQAAGLFVCGRLRECLCGRLRECLCVQAAGVGGEGCGEGRGTPTAEEGAHGETSRCPEAPL